MKKDVKTKAVHDLLEFMKQGQRKDSVCVIVQNLGGSIKMNNVTVQMFAQDNKP